MAKAGIWTGAWRGCTNPASTELSPGSQRSGSGQHPAGHGGVGLHAWVSGERQGSAPCETKGSACKSE